MAESRFEPVADLRSRGGDAEASRPASSMMRGAVLAMFFAVFAVCMLFGLAGAQSAYAASVATPTLQEFSGDNRYETSALQTEEAFPDGVESGSAVMVCGTDDAWPDALASSSLAGALEGPILLTKTSEIPDETMDLIESLGIDNIVIVGGYGVVDESVEEELVEMGISVMRLAGSTRYETQYEVYEYGKELGCWSSTAFVASGKSYADALSASAVAYSQCIPIFLINGDKGFTDNQVSALFDGSITEVVILGGTGAVSSLMDGYMMVVTMANSLAQGGSGESDVERLSGTNRYATSLAIAEWSVSEGYAGWDCLAYTSGTSTTDALSGSALQGRDGSVILLVDDEDCVTISGIEDYAQYVETYVRVFGGTGAVDVYTRDAICAMVNAPYLTYNGHEDYEIMGESEVTVDQMVALYEATGKEYPSEELGEGGASTIEEFCQILYEEAETEGVKAEVVFAQAMIETGWLQFGGDVSIEQFNFAGIGATGNGEAGNSFSDVQEGLRAQVQHLKAYACTDDLVNECVDPRFDLVTRGVAPTVQRLSMRWAMSSTYGDQIVTLIKKIKRY